MKLHPSDYLARPRMGIANRVGVDVLVKWAFAWALSIRHRLLERQSTANREQGDVSGWVMVTLMTAGLVVALWAVAGPRLEEVFNDAMDRVVGGP